MFISLNGNLFYNFMPHKIIMNVILMLQLITYKALVVVLLTAHKLKSYERVVMLVSKRGEGTVD